jgi:SAM-dependent methyltransferase
MPRSAERPLGVSSIGSELLDDPASDPLVVTRSLHNIARANRWFGGAAAARWGLGRVLAGEPPGSTFTLLDLGTGAGDLPLACARWAARRGIRLAPLGLERSRIAAALARDAGVPTMVADAGAPPLGDRSVDLVLVSQVAHHFDPDSIVALFRTADRLARRAVIVCDLRRSRIAQAGFSVGALLLGFDRVTSRDGHTSIRRGFTAAELEALLARAGIRARVARRPPWRLVAAWRTAAAGGRP